MLGRKKLFPFQLAKREMDSIFWGKDVETFAVNVYTRTHTYVFRILVSEFVGDPRLSIHHTGNLGICSHRSQAAETAFISLLLLNVLFSLAAQLGIFRAR